MYSTPARRSHAFTLIEMAIVLVVLGLAAVMVLGATDGFLQNQKRQNVRQRLDALETALANFVAINKRLPCPADGRVANGAAGAGQEALVPATGACVAGVMTHGVVPWVTLGVSANDASDPWNARFTYRVDPALAGAAPLLLLMNMSQCDPAATGPVAAGGACRTPASACTGSAGCTAPAAFLAGKGLDVWDGQNGAAGWAARQNNSSAGSGAAWVIISHGPTGAGAYGGSGILQPGSVVLGKDLEEQNVNAQALAKPATQANTYRDAPLNDNDLLVAQPPPPAPQNPARTQLHFDDYLSHPTLISVLNRANLGPRAH
jgi:prepilin-type N-terminal cleavage/methylation domain-containing protein